MHVEGRYASKGLSDTYITEEPLCDGHDPWCTDLPKSTTKRVYAFIH